MNVQSQRFGVVECDEDTVITFPSGLLGFSSYTRFVLVQPDDEGVFLWLQSTETPALGFVVTDPVAWMSEYEVPIQREQMDELGLKHLGDAVVLVIVNKREQSLTANMQDPLVVNVVTRLGLQMVMAEPKWTTRHRLVELAAKVGDATTSSPTQTGR